VKNAPLLHATEYGIFRLITGLVRLTPHAWSRSLGHALGNLVYRLLPGRRRIALRNLELAFPALDGVRRSEIALDAFRQMGSQATEFLSWSRFDEVALCRRLTLEGWEHLRAAAKQADGLFLMTAHIGHWELVGQSTGLYTPPVFALVRPLDNPRLDAMLAAVRTRFGLELVHKHGAARQLVRNLRTSGRMLVLLDQRVRSRDAVEVPFFGRPARVSNLIARLAFKHQTPVVPVYAYPAPGGCYRIVARPAIAADAGDDPVRELTTRYMAAVEAEIRRQPELWLWMHDLWKRP
jgi:KDO2-lipid IV(A) lauroyltransferase